MRWTVGTKIGAGFGIVSVIFLVVAAISYHSLGKLTETAEWVTHTHKVLEELADLLQALTDAETGQRGYIITANESYLEPYKAGMSVLERHIRELRDLTKDNLRQQQNLDALEILYKQRMISLKDVLDLQRTKGVDAAKEAILTGQGKQEMDGLRKVIAEMKDEETTLLKSRSEEAKASVDRAKPVILGGTLAAFFLSTLIGFFITRGISRPLREITSAAERMAEGDLSVTVLSNHREDEVGILTRTVNRMTQSLRQMAEVAGRIADGDLRVVVKPQSDKDLLGNAFTSMVANLQRLIGQIVEGVNTLSSSGNQVSTTTTQLASSAAQAATAVAETTTTVDEVRQTAQVASQKSKYVSDSAQKVAQSTLTGKQSIEATIEEIQRVRRQMESIADGMMRLSEQTQAVGLIIATVDDLAAQSNILAVNAAIEAAKAGEQGKGFAVVAQEVRSLAEQSRQATSQVRTVLGDIQKATSAAVMVTEQGTKAIEVGVKQSNEAGQSIQALSNSVAEAAQAAMQIAASSQQQLVGMDQVATAMESIKLASAQNVTGAKQLEAAAHNLKELGQKLKHTVDRYKL